MGEVTMKVVYKGRTVTGRGADTDIIAGSAKAFLHAVNKFAEMGDFRGRNRRRPLQARRFRAACGHQPGLYVRGKFLVS